MLKKLTVFCVIFVLLFSVVGLAACNNDDELADYKTQAIESLEAYAESKGQDNYTAENWEIIKMIVGNGKTTINAADSKDAVDTAKTAAITTINGVPKEEMMISFTLSLGRMDYGVVTNIQTIVKVYAEWIEMDAVANLPELNEKYDEAFFADKALLVFALGRGTKGAQFVKAEVSVVADEILVKVFDDENGHMDAESTWIVVLEVFKADINNYSELRIETNFNSFEQ